MNAFIDLTCEEQILELVTYTASLVKEDDADFAANCGNKISTGAATDVLVDLVGHTLKYFNGPKDCGAVFNSIARLLCLLKPDEATALVNSFTSQLADPSIDAHETAKIKTLGCLFNNLPTNSQARFSSYLALINVVGRHGLVNTVEKSFSQVDAWVVEWGLSAEQKRALFEALYVATNDIHHIKQCSMFLTKLLECCDGDDASLKSFATKLIALSLTDPDLFSMQSILSLPAVQSLKSEKCHELCVLFEKADLTSFQAWASDNSAVLSELGVELAELLRKIRLSRLALVCAGKSTVDYADIAKALNVDEDDVEMWIIEGIQTGLIEAKVDQVNNKVHVSRSSSAKFEQDQWNELKARLNNWQKNLAQCKRVMNTVKSQIDDAAKAARLGR